MARTICTYGSLDLNDGTSYAVMAGFDPGEETRVYSKVLPLGALFPLQLRDRASEELVTVTIPLRIRSTTHAGLKVLVDAINALIDAGPQTLVYGPPGATTSYSCALSQRLSYPRDEEVASAFTARVTLSLLRTP